ncbi:TetR/AcrR family transcriptional regulator [Priestia megaterium]|uniref:TetR/AcrR family transcriptional regulator n=1 Tax=Priestia megaterium TaxID=1404 RepID=UPI000D52446E|nr:TetR/AcrR family transcriptional regulator [Priestia megaterium]MDD1512170.1 TetR/AcrR family transcriptional regulator [Priestia megaterium]PVE70818.1 TetR family transcriptional regulator [Priestia megaterium]PVE88873.1 TetR family transcriptional regulator [Priestia megaterium]PVE92563.1 TetR family transcriptional regulator [Priestia megaterium]PVF01693.1 TetR family transcriptional regulator [Priestia megaterium]
MSTFDDILLAATQVVQRDGVGNLTLEKVAKEAGISKGGLLYHFSSKDELIKQMLYSVTKKYDDGLNVQVEHDNSPGKWSRAYLAETLHDLQREQVMSAGLLAGIATNPELLQHFQKQYEKWQQHIEQDDIDPVLATIVRLAADGLWFSQMFGLAPVDPDMQKQIQQQLRKLTEEGFR